LVDRDGGVERTSGDAGATIFLGVEDREMPAQDLVRLVTLEAPSTGIPTYDVALRVEHAYCVVDDRLDEQPEALGIVNSRRR
jgi:hypothetical protein